ncbi:MAG: hypothetical protein COV34_00420 [Candidatus Zambryskibacteria bacterium CG10_big_fil_rev_8_21_14_0_10_42_12]|uniref:Cation-transporting P-type ATPase N-terminal domain-containing protein n=1 Tax=Candidatus Zambryskibacteria bacterium CG10_big_fil_rev_8_21_14_0_10_42_12 TaxID=1975115 RepID=A0A2H0QWX9_9BACT|nr:MAG: hypothetical protein COV34_00420 [Candidatus Zambryskibacteria bacterium CG10_big_fil_rev_8_21_14_0_10_42_12]
MKDMLQAPWTEPLNTLIHNLESNEDGLTDEDVKKRLKKYGKNSIRQSTKVSIVKLLAHQILNPLVGVLVIAFLLSFFLDKTTEAIFVGVAILVNIFLGFFQEYKANNAIAKLEKYITHKTRVRRNGSVTYINSYEIVPGDVVLLRQGNRIPADIRLIKAKGVEADEAILTGESLAVKKELGEIAQDTPLGDRTNMVWGGTILTVGEAEGVVVATGEDTEIGKIAELVENAEEDRTPLEQAVSRLAKIISLILIVLGLFIFGIGLYAGFPVTEILLLAIAVIVSAVPESMPIAMSVVLAIGAETLAKKQGVVRKMSATETLGGTTLILTDKTGTLTEASLKLVHVDAFHGTEDDVLLEAGLNIDIAKNPETKELSGRPVERAIAHAVESKPGLVEISKQMKVLEMFPFDSSYKFSAVVFSYDNQKIVSLLGAPDVLLEKVSDNQTVVADIKQNITTYAENGERVLGVVSHVVADDTKVSDLVTQNNFTYQGLIRFRDPVRETVPAAVKEIGEAGVRTVIVTGDHPGTAKAVAQEIGLWKKDSLVITGADIEDMTDTELLFKLDRATVFARVTPEHKLRLVELYTKQGEVVAVTGDGVNDAPALKRAAIGVAMGAGTDVAHASSDLIVLNNNFETIVEAIFEGRNVLRKMRSVITYLLADSFDELMLVGGSIIISLPLPLTALQILFVKFFADIFPAMAFTFERSDAFGHSKHPPKTNLFDKKIRLFTVWRGLLSSMVLFVTYIVLLRMGFDETLVRTFTFTAFASYILFLAFSMRNLERSILSYNPFGNWWLTGGVLLGFSTTALAVYMPFMQNILGTVALPPIWLLGVIAIGITNLIVIELFKKFAKQR